MKKRPIPLKNQPSIPAGLRGMGNLPCGAEKIGADLGEMGVEFLAL
jgi:hypothetical protein